MNEQEALAKMVAPGTKRPGKYMSGVIQIHVTRACDKACYSCTQGSNLGGKASYISLENFEAAVISLKDYFGVVGVFGGNPAMSPQFIELCAILRKHIPKKRCGLWCNNPLTFAKAVAMQETFNPAVSNLNVHMDREAYGKFRSWWPESAPFGLDKDSRHSPCYVAMKDVVPSEEERWNLISNCDINHHWSAMICEFRSQPRAFFCEIAGAQAMLHQDEPDYPDTGVDLQTLFYQHTQTREIKSFSAYQELDPSTNRTVTKLPTAPTEREWQRLEWWQLPMLHFAGQVRKHCHECSVPLRGYGQLAVTSVEGQTEQVSETHHAAFQRLGVKGRHPLQLVTDRAQLEEQKLSLMTDYLGNSKR